MFNLPKNTVLGQLRLEETFYYFDIPRLFTCKNNAGSRFLVISTFDDYETYEWLYLPISKDRFSSLFSKSIPLRYAFTNPEDGYLFFVSSEFSGNAEVKYILPEQIKSEDLPDSDVYLESEKKLPVGLGVVDAQEAAIGTRRETCNLHFYPLDTRLPELDAMDLGTILVSFQELANALGQYCKGEVTLKGAISADIIEATKFRATQIFEGSFGIQLKSKLIADLFDSSLASDVLLELVNLLDSRDNEDNISNKLHSLKGRVASKYRRFLKEVTKIDSPLKIQWGSPNSERGKVLSISRQELKNAYALVSKIDIDMSESVVFRAELLGLDVETKRYRVKHIGDDEHYIGKISEESLQQVAHSEINGIYEVTLKKVIETNSSSGAELTKWVLVNLNVANK
jgi:hypothetical protein